MTICIGLIPNKDTVMLLQDSEISYEQVGFTQDIFNKIKRVNDDVITGVIGNPLTANEVLEMVVNKQFHQSWELRDEVEKAYHLVRERKLMNGILRKYGFSNVREVIQPPQGTTIDPAVREEVLKASQDSEGRIGISLILASNIESPQLYRVTFPGTGYLETNVKMYIVSGSGSIMAIDKMGEELDRYRWEKELSVDQGIDVLLRAGKASEKHQGVGGPFDITYITKREGKNNIIKPDQKKINMVMYLFPFGVDEKIMIETITRMRDEAVTPQELADYIKTHTKVGVEFDQYFRVQ